MRWLHLWFECDSTFVRRPFDCLSFVTRSQIPLRQSSHVCIGCRFVNESPSRRRYWCGKLSTMQFRCICRTSVFQRPRCQVDSIYGRRLLESWWFQGLGRQQASGALPSTGRPSGTVYQLLCEHLTDNWQGSSIIWKHTCLNISNHRLALLWLLVIAAPDINVFTKLTNSDYNDVGVSRRRPELATTNFS